MIALVAAGLIALRANVPPPGVQLYVVHAYVSQLPTTTDQVKLTLRTGRILIVDATIAVANRQTVPLYLGRSVAAVGYYDPKHLFHVVNMGDTDPSARYWPPDGPITLDYQGWHPPP